MFDIFNQKEVKLKVDQGDEELFETSSDLGRAYTSILSAKRELFKEHIEFNPLDYISNKAQFFGFEKLKEKPFTIPFEDSTHIMYVGPTRSAKGVALAHRAIEALRQKKGLIVIDPKQDDFLPQVILEELIRQGREASELLISSWPNNFGYSAFNKDDSYIEFSNKLIVALDLAPTGDPKADYYRRNERTLLKSIVKYYFHSEELLGIEFELNYKSLLNFIKYLMSDLNNSILYSKEDNKNKPNYDLLERYSKRYFSPKSFSTLELNDDDINTLKGLYQTILELDGATIYTEINLDDALYNGKVVYIQADQLDEASLKMLKMLQVDIIQKAKKKTANAIVLADEVSFYATKTLADSLSTIAGFGVHYILAMQDLAQLHDDVIKKPILSNCQTKIFYKSSDIETLEYIQALSGKELVTQMSKNEYSITMRQTQEDFMNITRLRAIKRDRVSILICEALNAPVFIQTWHINVDNKFNWSEFIDCKIKIDITECEKSFTVKQDLEKSVIDKKEEGVEV